MITSFVVFLHTALYKRKPREIANRVRVVQTLYFVNHIRKSKRKINEFTIFSRHAAFNACLSSRSNQPTWQTTIILITEKSRRPQFEPHAGIKMGHQSWYAIHKDHGKTSAEWCQDYGSSVEARRHPELSQFFTFFLIFIKKMLISLERNITVTFLHLLSLTLHVLS